MTKEPPLPICEVDSEFDSITMLAYGGGGTGKTEFLGSIGDRGVFLSCGEGQLTLKSPGFRSRHPKIPKIVFLREELNPATGMFKKAEAWDKFTDFCEWFVMQDDYDTLSADDASTLSIFARNRGMEANQELGQGSSLLTSNTQGFPITEVQDYNREMSIWTWFFLFKLPLFKERKKNFVMSAHEKYTYSKPINSKGNPIIGIPPVITKIQPAFTGEKLPDNIPGYFDFIWKFEVGNGTVFRCKTISNNNYLAKTRWGGVFPEEIKNPDFLKILNTIQSGGKYMP